MKIVHISLYPPKWELHCKKSWVAPYTKNLVTNIPYSENDKVFVVWDIDIESEIYIESWIEVRKVFKKWIFFYKNILKEIDDIKPDIVHIQQELALYGGVPSAVTLRFLLKWLKNRCIKIVTTFHGIVDIFSIDKEFMKENFSALPIFVVKFAFKFIFNPLIKYSDEIIVHEELFKKRILEQYITKSPENIHIVNHWIEDFSAKKITKREARNILKISENEKVLLFMWYVTGYKGIDLLIEWMTYYKEKIWKDFKLFILGAHHPKLKNDENYKKEYYRLKSLAEKNLWENVDWQEWFVDDAKMALYYPASDVVLFPYTRSIASSWPMALSIGYEIPFLASDVFSESIEDKSFLFTKEPEKMSEKIFDFFKNSEKFQNTISQMRKERLWSKIGKKTYNIYLI